MDASIERCAHAWINSVQIDMHTCMCRPMNEWMYRFTNQCLNKYLCINVKKHESIHTCIHVYEGVS